MGASSRSSAGIDPPAIHLGGGGAEAIQKVADLTVQGVKPEIVSVPFKGLGPGLPEAVPALLTPGANGGGLEFFKDDIEAFRTAPARRTGIATVTTLASFIDLVTRHKDDHSAIFARTEWPKPSLTAVIDYHEKGGGAARNGTHRVHYAFPVTPEFQTWIDHVGKPMAQAEFAAFLEDRAAELAAPEPDEVKGLEDLFKTRIASPNELIDLARSLEIRVGQIFKQSIKRQSGEAELVFQEEHTGRNGEAISIPGMFMIALRAFVDGAVIRLPARLRYRAAGGSVTWSYDLYRWQDGMRERVCEDLDKAGKDTGLPIFEGAPEVVR